MTFGVRCKRSSFFGLSVLHTSKHHANCIEYALTRLSGSTATVRLWCFANITRIPGPLSEGASCGVLRNLCVCTQVSVEPHPSDNMLMQELLFVDFAVTRMDVCAPYPGACYEPPNTPGLTVPECMRLHIDRIRVCETACLVLLDGRCVGTHPNGYELTWALRMARRHATHPIPYSTSVTHSHDMAAVYISTSYGRALQPLLVVDVATQRVVLQADNMDKGIGWMVRNGCIEFLDEHEVDSLTIAMTAGDLKNWRDRGGPFSHLIPHPSLMFSSCGNAGCFQNHVMSVRNTVHAGMVKQSMAGFDHPSSSGQYNLWYPQRPLVANRITYLDHDMCLMPTSQQCVVAITNAEARNATDAITVNRAALDRGMFHSTYLHTVRAVECSGDITGIPDARCTDGFRHGRYQHIRPGEYMVRPGVCVQAGDVLVARYTVVNQAQAARSAVGNHTNPARHIEEEDDIPIELGQATLYRDTSVLVPTQHAAPSYVHSVRVSPVCHSVTFSSQTTTDHILLGTFGKRCILTARRYEIVLRQDIPGDPGNKLVIGSSTSAKGVMTMPVAAEDMPYSARTGMQPDVLVNPLAFTRLMIGLLFELVQGKAQAMRENEDIHETFIDRLEGWEGTPFTKKNVREWVNTLKKHGYDGMGLEQLVDGRTGVPMEGLTCMGIVSVSVLLHVCSKKTYSRGDRGPCNARTRAPLEGRRLNGGLRLGEQESAMLVRQGLSQTLQRLLPGRSDAMQVVICEHCGLFMFSDKTDATKFCCPLESYLRSDIVHTPVAVVLPYSMMVLINELFVMGVLIQINPRAGPRITRADIGALDINLL